MLMLTLPKLEPTGQCRINGQQADYRVHADFLDFRYDGQEAWDRRRILDAFQDGDLIRYTCDDGPGSDGPYIVMRPPRLPGVTKSFTGWLSTEPPLLPAAFRCP